MDCIRTTIVPVVEEGTVILYQSRSPVPIMIGVVESSAEIVSCPLLSMYDEMSSAVREESLVPLASKKSFWREL